MNVILNMVLAAMYFSVVNLFISVPIIIFAKVSDPGGFLYATEILTIFIAVLVTLNNYNKVLRHAKAIEVDNVDDMDGTSFECYVLMLFEYMGYSVEQTGRSGDLGVDLIAQKGKERIAIQCKRYAKPVGRRAVSDAYAAMNHYNCNKCMVVTNNYFTPDAAKLARSTGCLGCDRNTLLEIMADFQADTNRGVSKSFKI